MVTKRKSSKVVILTDEQKIQKAVDDFFNDFDRTPIQLQPEPTRFYEVGEQVRLGNLTDVTILQSFDDGYSYLFSYSFQPSRDNPNPGTSWRVDWWFNIEKLLDTSNVPQMMADYKRFSATNSDLDSFMSYLTGGGLVCDPEYQREYVWTDANKDALLDSIFERLDIGAFLFIRHAGYRHKNSDAVKEYRTITGKLVSIPKKDDYTVSIIDGQQRLTTILDFVLERRPYRGIYFSQMNFYDQNAFMNTSVQFRIIEEEQVTKKDILRMFLQSNRGVPQSPEHLEKVQRMYDACE